MFMRRAPLALVVSVLALVFTPAPAEASPSIKFGIQDDGWLLHGPGTLDDRLDRLDSIGVQLYRYTLRWDQVAARKPKAARAHTDEAYAWGATDDVIKGLRARGIRPVVTLYGTPKWANKRRKPNWAPTSRNTFAAFAYAAAKRYGRQVDHWLVWNEPNKAGFFRPTSPRVYTALLNAAYPAIKAGDPNAAAVGAGVTAPRAGAGGVSPVDWIRGMRRYRARLDAYAHHPYPIDRRQTPWTGACRGCETITMASLPRLLYEVKRAWGGKRIWLTEYGYQTNPPDRYLGVSYARQAQFMGEAARRAYTAPRVDMLIHFLYRDDSLASGWQSGLITRSGRAKPAYLAWQIPVTQVSRRGNRVVVWGQVRIGSGRRVYRLQASRGKGWRWLGGTRRTNARGFFTVTVNIPRGTRLRAWTPRERTYSAVLSMR
jgi:hypothetical protein